MCFLVSVKLWYYCQGQIIPIAALVIGLEIVAIDADDGSVGQIMKGANNLMVLGALFAFGAGSANAGPCSTPSRDAGSGNVPGYTGQTLGSTATESKQHPPTTVMNKAADNTAMSSEDAKRQMQGQPTAADQSRQTEPAPSEQSQKMTAGTPEQTQPAPNEQSKKMTAGADQPAPSEKKPAGAAEEGC